MSEHDRTFPAVRTLPRASFSERDMKEVMESAAKIPDVEVKQALAALEKTPPPPQRPKERPPSLRLSTNDAVLLQARMQPRTRMESVGAVGRFSEGAEAPVQDQGHSAVLKKHRAYVIYGDVGSPHEFNASWLLMFTFSKRPSKTTGQRRASWIMARMSSPSTITGTYDR